MTSAGQEPRRRLAPHPASVGEGRRFVRELLGRGAGEEYAETAELLVSEVVTNALVHAGTDVEIHARVEGTGVRIEVYDGSPRLPRTKNHAGLASTGRGLHLLEQLVDRWGAERRDEGKIVWFELGHPSRSPSEVQPEVAVPAPSVAVELHDVPLLLHAAWQMQAEALLRELLLSDLTEATGAEEIERHSAAADALAVLREQVPDPTPEDPSAPLMGPDDREESFWATVRLQVPRASLPHFELLDELLTRAIALADAGEFLTPPTQPEVRALRHWICRQVLDQAAGGPPHAWDAESTESAPPREAATFDPSEVDTAATAVVAADDTSHILAASPAALALLGYADRADLVGLRLVEIIPSRLRQAHLAGFTLHLFAERSPLIGTSVVVPALRQDGSEVPVRLTIRADPLPGGRRVFVADLVDAADLSD